MIEIWFVPAAVFIYADNVEIFAKSVIYNITAVVNKTSPRNQSVESAFLAVSARLCMKFSLASVFMFSFTTDQIITLARL